MAAGTAEGRSETEAMAELVSLMWERYIAPRAKKELLGHALDGYKAQVVENNGDGTLTVQRPFDDTAVTLRCPPLLAQTANAGDFVLVVSVGDMSNAFILCRTDMSGLGNKPLKTSLMDFSNWDNGYFFELIEGVSTPQVYTVNFDGSGRPISVRDNTGHSCTIRWDPIPATHILVTVPPNKTTYSDGELIDYSGIVVTAYDENNAELMDVPIEELVLSVSAAVLPAQDEYAKYPDTTYYIAGSQANVGRLRSGFSSSYYSVLFPQGMRFVLAHRSEGYYFCAVSETAFDSGCYYGRDGGGYVTADTPVDASAYGSKEIDGVTYYYCFWGVIETRTPEDDIDPLVTFPGNWTNGQRIAACIPMCYGPNASRGTPQATVSVPVQWRNGSDTLETTFSITVYGEA